GAGGKTGRGGTGGSSGNSFPHGAMMQTNTAHGSKNETVLHSELIVRFLTRVSEVTGLFTFACIFNRVFLKYLSLFIRGNTRLVNLQIMQLLRATAPHFHIKKKGKKETAIIGFRFRVFAVLCLH
uniref:Uncharacterized protein n=1 Tax=Stegastes partitus TaxID=144197 RepID=A0A3B5A8A6_9TELE